jgi:hypothetical protein
MSLIALHRVAPKKLGVLNIPTIISINALMFIMLGVFSGMSAIGYEVEEVVLSPCENVINSTVLNSTSNTTAYTYANSCAGDTAPPIVLALFYASGAAMMLLLFQILIGVLILSVEWLRIRW